jgi:hypothetical protein
MKEDSSSEESEGGIPGAIEVALFQYLLPSLSQYRSPSQLRIVHFLLEGRLLADIVSVSYGSSIWTWKLDTAKHGEGYETYGRNASGIGLSDDLDDLECPDINSERAIHDCFYPNVFVRPLQMPGQHVKNVTKRKVAIATTEVMQLAIRFPTCYLPSDHPFRVMEDVDCQPTAFHRHFRRFR